MKESFLPDVALSSFFAGVTSRFVASAVVLLSVTPASSFELTAHTQSVLATIIGEDVLSMNIDHVRKVSATLPVAQRYRMLAEWVLPNHYRQDFRFRGAFSQTFPPPNDDRPQSSGEIVSSVIDLIKAASQCEQLLELARRVEAIEVFDNLARRQRAAILFLIARAQHDPVAAQRTLKHFAALFESFDLETPERYWPELIVASEAAGVPEFGQTTQDLIVELHKHRLQYFGDPRKDVFLDHARWLQGLQEYCIAKNVSRKELPSAVALKNWTSVGYWEAKSRGHGKPVANWQFDGTSVRKIGGHELDHLMFRMPLRGNYQIECDYSIGGDTGSSMMVAGVHLERIPGGVRFGSFRKDTDANAFVPALSQARDWNHFRAEVRDGKLTQWLNGRVAFERKLHREHDPWIALRSWRRGHCELKNVRITGTPEVSEMINLTSDPQLSGWAPYYEEGFLNRGNWRQQESRGGNTIYGRFRPELVGTMTEKLLRYHRPMLEDGEIRYDFFHKRGETMIHPALDRCCFILEPDGVKIHWLTDRTHDNTGADPANLTIEADSQRAPSPLPFVPNEWNTLSLKLTGDVAQLSLNDVPVYERTMEAGNQRTFGLFHYADQTDAMIRNVSWEGKWPKSIPPLIEQELRGTDMDLLDKQLAELPATLACNFQDGVPQTAFEIEGDSQSIEQGKDGIRLSLDKNKGLQNLRPRVQVKGDFDIELQFRDLEIDDVYNNTTGIALVLFFDSDKGDNCGLYRRYQGYSNDGLTNHHRLLFARKQTDPGGNPVYRGIPTAEESNSGKIRLARRGTTLTALYAEENSPFYRIVGTGTISRDVELLATIQLLLQAPKDTSVKVVWQKLTIRAEQIIEEHSLH